MEALAEQAVATYGRIDTWVNNAGVSIYGLLREILAAIPHLWKNGGALINVGGELPETALPLQGHYAASKHAVKGFTDTLRMELHHEGAPIAVTLIQPAAIDTPYPEHAMNYLGVEPTHMAPVYASEVVADAILDCAQSPHRNLRVGSGAKLYTMTEKTMPGAGDKMKERSAFDGSKTNKPPRDDDTLYAPRPGDGKLRGEYEGQRWCGREASNQSTVGTGYRVRGTRYGGVRSVGVRRDAGASGVCAGRPCLRQLTRAVRRGI